MSRREAAIRLLRTLRPHAALMIVSATARVINQALGVAIAAVAAVLVVDIDVRPSLGALLAILVTLAVVKGVFRYLEQFTGHAVAFRLLSEMRIETFRSIVPLAPAGLEEERTGDLVSRVVGDIDRVEPFYAHAIAPLAGALVVPLLAAAGLAIWVDPVVSLAFIPFPLLIGFAAPWLRSRRVAALAAEQREHTGATAAMFTETIQGARDIAVFRARDTFAEQLARRGAATSGTRRALSAIASQRATFSDLLTAAAVVTVSAVAASRLGSGLLEPAQLAASVVVAWVGTTPARAMDDIVESLEQALAAAGRLFAISERPRPVDFVTGDTGKSPHDGSVVFEDVGVNFAGSSVVALDGVDLSLESGSTTAVVGASGSGKSTLVELLPRFRDPDSGRVVVGGIDLKAIAQSSLSRAITLVPQRPEIFFGSVADNLLLAKPEASESEMWIALTRAGLGDWARSLPGGLGTRLGEIGETLSGGQRQRISLARAFLRDPLILILDEATSELDAKTEAGVLAEIGAERGRRTLIIVAHRLDTVRDADEIVVLDGGRLVERGTHESLLVAKGTYAGLWERHLDVVAAPT